MFKTAGHFPGGVEATNARQRLKRTPKPPRAAFPWISQGEKEPALCAAKPSKRKSVLRPGVTNFVFLMLCQPSKLNRLKTQINNLIWKFTRPQEFLTELRELLELYSDRTFRPGKASPSAKLPTSYRVPTLVIRQLELELTPLCQENPQAALTLMDALWNDPFLEPRILAALLLGKIDPAPPDMITNHLQRWCQPECESVSLSALLEHGTYRLRREQSEHWFELLHFWLADKNTVVQKIALRAMLPAIQDREFENLPPLFRMIEPFLKSPLPALQTEIVEILQALANRSPIETAYLLRQALAVSNHPLTVRIVRRLLPLFSPEEQNRLRS